MSVAAVNYVRKLSGLKISEKFLLTALAHYLNDSAGVAWPSIPTLAADCSMSERTVCRALASLEKKNHIKRVHGAVNYKNIYQLPGFQPADKTATPDRLSPLTETPATPDRNDRPPLTETTVTPDNHDTPYKEGTGLTGKSNRMEGEATAKPTAPPPQPVSNFCYGNRILDALRLPAAKENLKAAVQALECEIKAGRSAEEAFTLIVNGCQDARTYGEAINKYAFIDARYRPENRRKPAQTFSQMRRSEQFDNYHAALELLSQQRQVVNS